MRWRRLEPDLGQPRNQVCDTTPPPSALVLTYCCSLDLSWNYASESQAYDRVHRLGQEKEVHIKRIVVRDTIEERYAFGSFSVVDAASETLTPSEC